MTGPSGPTGTSLAGQLGGNSGATNLPGNANVRYGTFFGNGIFNLETEASQVLANSGTASNLYVRLTGAPGTVGSGKAWTFTIFRNHVAVSNLTCTVSDAATTCSDLTGTEPFNAGDTISIQITAANMPSSGVMGSWAIKFV